MGRIYALLTGPRLYRVFGRPEHSPNVIESIGNHSMSLGRGLFYFSTSLAFSPIILALLYSRGALNIHTGLIVLKYATYLAILAYGGRLVGRTMDSEYRQFINVWLKARDSGKSEDNRALKRFDFDIEGVNADFQAVRNENFYYHHATVEGGPLMFCAAWYAVHAFGRHMLYPGSVSLLNWLLSGSLLASRNLMVSAKDLLGLENNFIRKRRSQLAMKLVFVVHIVLGLIQRGRRAWLKTTEDDLIDAMYIPGEEDGPENRSRTLVIACEGNAGYYEIGIAHTPAQLGYSVLGWNQPGFGQSSGIPFPNNTLAAADAVMQYALKELGFREEDIVLFGWSIGGYPVSWLAANYPKVKAVILDATFDDVLPLAQARMPKILADIVQYAIRTHFDLDIQAILAKYKGPLKLIRRLQEEILVTDDTGSDAQRRATNRVNFLLKSVLRQRHPALMVDLETQIGRSSNLGQSSD